MRRTRPRPPIVDESLMRSSLSGRANYVEFAVITGTVPRVRVVPVLAAAIRLRQGQQVARRLHSTAHECEGDAQREGDPALSIVNAALARSEMHNPTSLPARGAESVLRPSRFLAKQDGEGGVHRVHPMDGEVRTSLLGDFLPVPLIGEGAPPCGGPCDARRAPFPSRPQPARRARAV